MPTTRFGLRRYRTPWLGEASRALAGGTPSWVEFTPSPYHSSRSSAPVRAVIFHFTAGPRLEGTVRWFQQNDRSVSAHYVIGKDGRTVQMVPLERAAHHAGKGQLPETSKVNASSVGIEIVNWGPLTQAGSVYKTHNGKPYTGAPPVEARDASGRMRWWEPFTEAQYNASVRLTRDLVSRLPDLAYVTGHQDVARPYGRKNDPGGAFDWDRIRAGLVGFRGHVGPLPAAPGVPPASTGGNTRGLDVARAVAANRIQGPKLGWQSQVDSIARVLGFKDMTPDERGFASAVAFWQRGHGLTADGILGPRTWAAMREQLGAAAVSSRPTAAPPAAALGGSLGVLTVTAPGFNPVRYRFTQEDALWLARMLVGEAGGRDTPENQAVVWAMFNRYALAIRQSAKYTKSYLTFEAFIRSYSTTLQPCLHSAGAAARHYKGPDYQVCPSAGNYPGTSIPRGQRKKYLELQRTPWDRLPAAARSLAARAMSGQLPNPIGNATHFANTAIYYRQNRKAAPTLEQWREYTNRYAKGQGWKWIGPQAALSEQSQMRGNAFFVQNRFGTLPKGAVLVTAP